MPTLVQNHWMCPVNILEAFILPLGVKTTATERRDGWSLIVFISQPGTWMQVAFSPYYLYVP